MKVSDFFNLKYGHSLALNSLTHSNAPDAINFVSRSARNNGVTARVNQVPGLLPAEAGTITVALNGQGGAGVAFLQPFPYYCGFHVMVLTPKSEMTEQEKLWWAMCITANRYRFGFGRQANRTLKDLDIPDVNMIPEWVFLTNTALSDDVNRSNTEEEVALSDREGWGVFTIQSLFTIKKGKRLTKANMKTGEVPFIGAIDKNNGVSNYVSHSIHSGNTITVNYNGSVGEAFFQPKSFWASDDVNVLYPKFQMTKASALFICAVIRQEQYRFNFGRKWHLDRMCGTAIRLPSTEEGLPDWSYIDRYIQSLPYSSRI